MIDRSPFSIEPGQVTDDTRMAACLAGALLGAVHGEDAIPNAWRPAVLNALQGGPPSGLRDLYHPRVLLELAP
jgi:ADP-ribosyl-[dinitrogen reductase] hydrolase